MLDAGLDGPQGLKLGLEFRLTLESEVELLIVFELIRREACGLGLLVGMYHGLELGLGLGYKSEFVWYL